MTVLHVVLADLCRYKPIKDDTLPVELVPVHCPGVTLQCFPPSAVKEKEDSDTGDRLDTR